MNLDWTLKQMLSCILFTVVLEAAMYTGGLWPVLLCCVSWVLAMIWTIEQDDKHI